MNAAPNVNPSTSPRTWSSVAALHWLRAQLFSSPLNTLLTLLTLWLLLATVPAMVDWFFLNSTVTATSAQECRKVTGACWAVIVEKHRLILFGVYPYEEQWRPLLATLLLLGVIILSGVRRFWNLSLLLFWVLALSGAAVLMWGGVFVAVWFILRQMAKNSGGGGGFSGGSYGGGSSGGGGASGSW